MNELDKKLLKIVKAQLEKHQPFTEVFRDVDAACSPAGRNKLHELGRKALKQPAEIW